jgi:hypothetical protein
MKKQNLIQKLGAVALAAGLGLSASKAEAHHPGYYPPAHPRVAVSTPFFGTYVGPGVHVRAPGVSVDVGPRFRGSIYWSTDICVPPVIYYPAPVYYVPYVPVAPPCGCIPGH